MTDVARWVLTGGPVGTTLVVSQPAVSATASVTATTDQRRRTALISSAGSISSLLSSHALLDGGDRRCRSPRHLLDPNRQLVAEALVRQQLDLAEPATELPGVQDRRAGPPQRRGGARHGLLGQVDDLLHELLAGPRPHDRDLHVLVRDPARHPDDPAA